MFKVELGSSQALLDTCTTIKISSPWRVIKSHYRFESLDLSVENSHTPIHEKLERKQNKEVEGPLNFDK